MFRIIILIALIIVAIPMLTKCKEGTEKGLEKAKMVGTIAEKAFRYSKEGKDK